MDDATVIDAAADVEGRIQGQDARIHGRFKGDIELKGRLTLGEGAKVDAKVRCESAEVAGEFQGELRARRATLLEKAKVSGTVVAEVLAIRDGAVVNAAIETATPPAK
jgi:cytoskeletal protein CcmA (bactofilin family)